MVTIVCMQFYLEEGDKDFWSLKNVFQKFELYY